MVAIAVGVSTAIIWVGLPILAATVLVWRWGARVERRWAEIALGVAIADPHRPLPAGTRRKRWGVLLRDPATWKDLLYLFLRFPLGIAYFVITVTLWAWALWLLFMPAYYWLLPGWPGGAVHRRQRLADRHRPPARGRHLHAGRASSSSWSRRGARAGSARSTASSRADCSAPGAASWRRA